jgi:hypothetical protein
MCIISNTNLSILEQDVLVGGVMIYHWYFVVIRQRLNQSYLGACH